MQATREVPLSGRRPRRVRGGGRHLWLLGLMVAVLGAVAVRLVWIQAVSAPVYAAMAEAQRSQDTTLGPRRGAIFDREGEQLAGTTDAKTIYATPHAVVDPRGTAVAIARALGGNATAYERKLRRDSSFVYIARKVDVDRARSLEGDAAERDHLDHAVLAAELGVLNGKQRAPGAARW